MHVPKASMEPKNCWFVAVDPSLSKGVVVGLVACLFSGGCNLT